MLVGAGAGADDLIIARGLISALRQPNLDPVIVNELFNALNTLATNDNLTRFIALWGGPEITCKLSDPDDLTSTTINRIKLIRKIHAAHGGSALIRKHCNLASAVETELAEYNCDEEESQINEQLHLLKFEIENGI